MGHPVYKIQHDERDCGPTCLYMVSAYYGLKRPLSFYRKLTKMDKNGSNIYGLVDAGSKIGFETVPLVSDLNDLLTELQSGKLTFPFIVILSILVDTFISKISFPMQPGPEIGSISDA